MEAKKQQEVQDLIADQGDDDDDDDDDENVEAKVSKEHVQQEVLE